MDNYIIRIYRREGKDPSRVVGVVEKVGVEGKQAFGNLDELWTILTAPRGRGSRRGPAKGHGNSVDETKG